MEMDVFTTRVKRAQSNSDMDVHFRGLYPSLRSGLVFGV